MIAKNSANPYNKALFPKLPNLRGGLATYYAAAEAGKYKAADMARKLAYTEATEQPLPDVAKTAKTQTSNKRYVKADLGLNLRSEPGTSKQVIGKLSKGTEVEFTGNKTGKIGNHEWAEIKYGDKTGWVAAEYLNTEMPYVLDGSNMQKSFEKDKIATQATPESQKDSGATRYIGKNEMFLYESPNMKSNIIMAGHWGDEVIFTGEKKKGNRFEWAKVIYKGKTGWVRANGLKVEKATAPKIDVVGYATENKIRFHENATIKSKIIDTVALGDDVMYLGEEKQADGFKWTRVKYNGKIGWVKSNYFKSEYAHDFFDANAPRNLLVKKQENDVQNRTYYLNQNIPNWIKNDEQKPEQANNKNAISEWYKNTKLTNVKYTGPYCLPVPIDRINQGFYGLHSHAGSNYESGHLGAIDFQAPPGTSVYSVLGGKVAYTYKEAPENKGADMHRVTVETKINGDTYYLEYLHMDSVDVIKGQTLHAGTQLGKSGGWGNYSPKAFDVHLDFRVYKFVDKNDKSFSDDSKKQFFDPLEFFDFDVQFEYNMAYHDYH